MEGKKCTKISVSTFLLIITIIALGVMGFFIYKISDEKAKATNKVDELNNQVTDLTKTVDDLKNSINNNIKNNQEDNNTKEKASNKTNVDDTEEISFIQFDTKFYDTTDCIINLTELNVSNNTKTLEYDLNKDGNKEKITFKGDSEKTNGMYLQEFTAEYNGNTFYKDLYNSRIGFLDLDENDNSIEIVILNAGPSDDPNVYIYKLVDGEIKLLKHLGDITYIDKKGKMIVSDYHNPTVSPMVFNKYYEIDGNTIVEKKSDLSKFSNTTFSAKNGLFTTDLANISKIMSSSESNYEKKLQNANIKKLTENDTFKIIDFNSMNEARTIKIQLDSGEQGYLLGLVFAD